MNNFNLPAHELFAGTITWFGAKQLSLEPLTRQDGSNTFTTQDWPSMSHRMDSANTAFVSHLSRLLFVNSRGPRLYHTDLSTQTVLDSDQFVSLFGQAIDAGWMGIDRVSINRWRFFGLSDKIAIRALAKQRHERIVPYAEPEGGPITVDFRPLTVDAATLLAMTLRQQR